MTVLDQTQQKQRSSYKDRVRCKPLLVKDLEWELRQPLAESLNSCATLITLNAESVSRLSEIKRDISYRLENVVFRIHLTENKADLK